MGMLCVYIYGYVFVSVCVYLHICLWVCVCIDICMYISVFACMFMCIYMYVSNCVYGYACVCVYLCVCECLHCLAQDWSPLFWGAGGKEFDIYLTCLEPDPFWKLLSLVWGMYFFFSFLSSITLSFLVPDHVSQAKKGSVSNNIGVDRSFNQEYIFPRRVASRLFLPWKTSEVGFLLCLGQGWSSQWHTDLTQQIHFSTSNPMSANGVTQLF